MTTSDNNANIEGIAIIGMACRFPGASDPDAFWENLCSGTESISFFSDDEIDQAGDSSLYSQLNYVNARGILKDADKFDAALFGINPLEAQMMDPQQRVFLELTWEALENAGYNPDSYDGLIGVYAGMGENTYYLNHVLPRRDLIETFGGYQTGLVNHPHYLATKVSYKLNLKGPSVNVYTGCSTSLAAVCQGVDSLMSYQSDIVISGGIFIWCPQNQGYLYQEGGILSPDGHCRTFDASAQGTVLSNGGGAVVLKRLGEALRDGDNIYSVIRGTGMNNNGALPSSFTAPSVEGQSQAVAMAQGAADIDPGTITYIETHGTGTALGDPIEIAGLTEAFRLGTDKKEFCAIGSVKTNIGHLDAAAGIAGLIKTSLALKHAMIPPSINFEKPNPKLEIENSPFYVISTLSKWATEGFPRRAGVSSLGVGGTNAHVVLEEAPNVIQSGNSRPFKLVVLSAKTKEGLDTVTSNLSRYLKKNSEINLADVSYTIIHGRKILDWCRIAVYQNSRTAAKGLEELQTQGGVVSSKLSVKKDVVFMFSGQGSQYVNMGRDLYHAEPEFRFHVNHCSEILSEHLSFDLREVIYPSDDKIEEAQKKLKQTYVTQPALFVIEYSLARLWMKWGIKPSAMVGHSIGEYVAACLSGVFSIEDALALVAKRGQLIQSLPGGSMIAVSASESEILPLLSGELSLALINGPELCVVSGETTAVLELEKKLTSTDIHCRHLHTSHAFHSSMLDPILNDFYSEVEKIHMNAPEIPFVSNVSGKWITPGEAITPDYWVSHMRRTVRFSECLTLLTQEKDRIFLEIGPGNTLATFARQSPEKTKEQAVLCSIRHPREKANDSAFILNTLGRLWVNGAEVGWSGFFEGEKRRRIPLPTYPFKRTRYWIDPVGSKVTEKIHSAGETEKKRKKTFLGSERLELKHKQPGVVNEKSDIEQLVAEAWQDILGIDHVGPNDNFFELGGSSLSALSLFVRIEKVIGKKLPLSTLFKAPTVKQLSDILRNGDRDVKWRSLVKIYGSGNKNPLFLIHGAGGNVLIYRDLARYLGRNQPVYGLQSQGLDSKQHWHTNIESMAAHYIKEIKSVQKEGPYLLCGYCMGGSVALEMAQQLRKDGQETSLLALLETYNFSKIPSQSLVGNMQYYLQKIYFHWKNLEILDKNEKKSFLYEKLKIAKNRTSVWSGMIKSKISYNANNGNGSTKENVLFKVWENNDLAAFNYIPKAYDGRITEILPLKKYAQHSGPEMGWEKIAIGGLETYVMEAYPAGMLVEPFVKNLAEILRKCIDGTIKTSK